MISSHALSISGEGGPVYVVFPGFGTWNVPFSMNTGAPVNVTISNSISDDADSIISNGQFL